MSDDDKKGFKKDSAFKEKEKAGSDKSEKYSKIKSKINSFAESSEILLKILEDVQGIHPFIGVAVIAFKAVISLELKRRENDDKVMFLLVKIQDMMGILVQLRVIPPGTKAENQPITVETRLSSLCVKIEDDIKKCGNLCDTYSKKRFLVKILKGPIYELRLAEMGENIDERQKELQLALAMFTADGVQTLKVGVQSTEESVNMLLLFQMSRSPLERELVDFVESKGGAAKCMEDRTLLKELIDMRRDHSSQKGTQRSKPTKLVFKTPGQIRPGGLDYETYAPPGYKGDGYDKVGSRTQIRKLQERQLKRELELNADEEIQRNMSVFNRKFDVQQRQLLALERTVVQQGDRVAGLIQEGSHNRIIDEEMRAIWKEMGWKLVVPTSEFVLTLHDYFVSQHHDMRLVSDHFSMPALPGSSIADEMSALNKAFALAKQRSASKWALECLHMSNMGPVSDAFDADASGYVSVWEANQVISLRPNGWSLVQWLAYWASGRQHTINQYTARICDILRDMHVLQRTRVLPVNRYSVDCYLDGMKILDRVLSSVAQGTSNSPPGGELAERVEQYTRTEEDRMDHVLQALGYEIDGQDTIELITSRYQIERNFFPLVYLLLRQHFTVIHTGCGRLLDRRELEIARQSLKVIFRAVKTRVSMLEGLLAPRYHGLPSEGMRNIAFGMYYNVYSKIDKFLDIPISDEKLVLVDSVGNSIPQARSEPPQAQDFEDGARADAGADGPLDFESCIGDHINGYWSGYLRNEGHNIVGGVVQFRVSDWDSRSFSGEGSYLGGTLRVEGTYDRDTGKVEATIVGPGDARSGGLDEMTCLRIALSGTVEEVSSSTLPNQYTIAGTWRDVEGEPGGGVVLLSQTPAWVHQLRWTPPTSRSEPPMPIQIHPMPGQAPPIRGETPPVRGETPPTLGTTSQVFRWEPPTSSRLPDNPARSRWRFALRAVFYRIHSERDILDATYCVKKLEMIRQSVQLLKHHNTMGSPHVQDESTMEMTMGATQHLPPSNQLDVPMRDDSHWVPASTR
ncbi:hypothetical protein PQX77_005806 [Marasmius sp. AFHP31]|nr:hypothetical protein PQX77_005806 [Marasmius sp. AFHP31]